MNRLIKMSEGQDGENWDPGSASTQNNSGPEEQTASVPDVFHHNRVNNTSNNNNNNITNSYKIGNMMD